MKLLRLYCVLVHFYINYCRLTFRGFPVLDVDSVQYLADLYFLQPGIESNRRKERKEKCGEQQIEKS